MRRDEDWFDAVGKNDWRQEQIEQREKERKNLNEVPTSPALPKVREQRQPG